VRLSFGPCESKQINVQRKLYKLGIQRLMRIALIVLPLISYGTLAVVLFSHNVAKEEEM